MTKKTYLEAEVREATLDYFDGDELATNVWVTKYALQNKEGFLEKTPDDMHRRLASEFARAEEKYDNSMSEEEIYSYFKDFDFIVPQGSPMYGIGNEKPISLSNCVVVDSPEDTMSSIANRGRDLANLFKRRAGVGLDLSTLRPEGSIVNNAAKTTSGAWSFADYYSYVCRMVGQNGRRGALMITMNVDHPDIEKFVTMKSDLKKVTGANVSVKITDEFMEAVRAGDKFELTWQSKDGSVEFDKTVDAKALWNLIVTMAKENAEPGLIMWDNVTKELPAHEYDQFKTISTNPCSELPLSAYDSCRLISINLKHLVTDRFTENARFDYDRFRQVVRVGMRLNDDLVDLELEKLEQILQLSDKEDEAALWRKLKKACEEGRRTGLGTHGLADCLANLRVAYDSEEGIEVVEKIYQVFRDEAYRTSVELAKERGAFPAFDWEVEKDNAFIQRLPDDILSEMAIYGRRNVSLLTCAPTGSVSICSQTSSGVEPVFRNAYIRRRKLGQDEQHIDPDFVDDLGDRWMEFTVYHHNVREYMDMFDIEDESDLPDFFVTSDQIDWRRRIDIQAAQQRGIDHSISSTINLPADISTEVVGDLYMRAWEKGLKGVTVYVEGSRSGVLLSGDGDDSKDSHDYDSLLELLMSRGHVPEDAELTDEGVIVRDVRLPSEYSNGNTHKLKADGMKYYLHMSYLPGDNNFPLALWVHSNEVQTGEYVSLNRAIKSVTKLLVDKGVEFDLVYEQLEKIKDDYHHVKLGKMIGMALRHNIDILSIIDALTDIEGDYIASTLTAVRKFLKMHVKDGTKVEYSCPECGGEVIFEDGCERCLACGNGKCH